MTLDMSVSSNALARGNDTLLYMYLAILVREQIECADLVTSTG